MGEALQVISEAFSQTVPSQKLREFVTQQISDIEVLSRDIGLIK